MNQPTEKVEMKTMVSCMNKLQAEGFTENFTIDEKGTQLTAEDGHNYTPTQVKIADFYRFEGDSDPGDNAILYGIETEDGIKGILVDAYGLYADSGISKFIKNVEEIEKKNANVHKE